MAQKIFNMSFEKIYHLYLSKIQKKGREKSELDQAICWLSGYDYEALNEQINSDATVEQFFSSFPKLNEKASLIKGVICGYRCAEIEDDLMRRIRYLDKLVDELAKGKSLDKILKR